MKGVMICWMQFQNHFEEPGATLALVEHEKVLGTSGMFGVLPKLFKK